MIILVTGGAGFIGSNLCRTLLDMGNIVICLDNLFTGSMSNINDLMDNPNFNFILHDILYPINIKYKIDKIYHLACPASPPKYQKDPLYTSNILFTGSWNVLKLALHHKCKVLLASTSEVYGEPTISPQHEKYRGNVNTIGIRSCYDEGKRMAESIFMDFYRTYKIDIAIVRIFNTYGPYMDKNDGRVVSNIINQILNNEDITIYGDGSQTRSFCYVDDLVSGIIKLMETNYIYPVNIGNDTEFSINELVNILKLMTNSESNIVYKPLPSDDPTNRKPDLTVAKKILDWEPTIQINDGLLKTIEYFKIIQKQT